MLKNISYFLLVALITLGAISCRKSAVGDEREREKQRQEEEARRRAEEAAKGIKTLKVDVSGLKNWKFVSFKEGKVLDNVNLNNSKASLDWDMGLNFFYYKTNSGTSGKGKGGAARLAIDSHKADMKDFSHKPDPNAWVEDQDYSVMVKFSQRNAEWEVTGLNLSLTTQYDKENDWMGKVTQHGVVSLYNPKAPEHGSPDVKESNEIFYVRCADGTYAKCRLTGWDNTNTFKKVVYRLEYQYPVNL